MWITYPLDLTSREDPHWQKAIKDSVYWLTVSTACRSHSSRRKIISEQASLRMPSLQEGILDIFSSFILWFVREFSKQEWNCLGPFCFSSGSRARFNCFRTSGFNLCCHAQPQECLDLEIEIQSMLPFFLSQGFKDKELYTNEQLSMASTICHRKWVASKYSALLQITSRTTKREICFLSKERNEGKEDTKQMCSKLK